MCVGTHLVHQEQHGWTVTKKYPNTILKYSLQLTVWILQFFKNVESNLGYYKISESRIVSSQVQLSYFLFMLLLLLSS